jgi:outer membrane immunogenic protein
MHRRYFAGLVQNASIRTDGPQSAGAMLSCRNFAPYPALAAQASSSARGVRPQGSFAMRWIATVAFACASLIVASGAASAADIRRRPPPPAPPPYVTPIYNWTGFYIGINGGGAWGTSNWDSTGGFDVSGGLIGGTLGYNWQVNQVVFGIEGDLDWANIKGNTPALCPFGCETENSWLGTVRGRIGYAFDRFLPYFTGGLAVGKVKASLPGFAGADDTGTGWTVGGGVEFALPGRWTAKVEYLYVDLGSFNCGLNCGALIRDNVDFNANVVRAGINYRF